MKDIQCGGSHCCVASILCHRPKINIRIMKSNEGKGTTMGNTFVWLGVVTLGIFKVKYLKCKTLLNNVSGECSDPTCEVMYLHDVHYATYSNADICRAKVAFKLPAK